MKVTVRLFAAARDLAGWDQRELELPPGSTVSDARKRVSELLPSSAQVLSLSAFAVNRQFARLERALNEGDEVAVLPPVSGG